ncbi:hypothetical protein LTR27_006845 [Elasticomyces elasticus]|nr:hypothetical protein LTR27_006845 [Elasticomyces elasticus]
MLELFRIASLLLLASTGYATSSDGDASGTATATVSTSDTSTVVPARSTSSVSVVLNPRPGNSTCRSGTLNYITHTLPQQCLRADRILANATQILPPIANNATRSAEQSSAVSTLIDNVDLPTLATVLPSKPSSVPVVSTESHTSTISLIAVATTISTVTTSTEVASVLPAVIEEPSLFDSASFLSFEEWKQQNLAKTGQSAENIGQERSQSGGDRQRPGINNALDTLGEDSEIDLDFAGFGNAAAAGGSPSDGSHTAASKSDGTQTLMGSHSSPPTAKLRSKDAGKTCKERTNYASFDCAATVMKQNPECKHSSSILVENKDSYMLNKCAASNKFFIVELCNDIHIDTIVLANYEFFSSIFRHFRVSVSDRYPVKADKWKDLGTFEARNTREVQAFLVEEPQIWARYLRIEFLTHYGSEYYCPVSLLRVHGRTMMQEFRQEEEMARGEVADEELVLDSSPVGLAEHQEPLASTDEATKPTIQAIPSIDESSKSISERATAQVSPAAVDSTSTSPVLEPEISTSAPPSLPDLTCAPFQTLASDAGFNSSTVPGTPSLESNNIDQQTSRGSSLPSSSTSSATISSQPKVPLSPAAQLTTDSSVAAINATSTFTSSLGHHNASVVPVSLASSRNVTSSISTGASITASASSNSTRSTSTASPAPQASSQESFFKSISKRLQQLESNSTLSLQYIEEQSRTLRDAFNKVEKRQISATTTFLSQLNDTVMTELHGFRQAYDQLWQGTVIELEGQREQYQREMLALSSRLTLVADELVWQKRMGIVQSTLLLVCLGLVLFARQGNTGYMESTLAQQLMSRSQAAIRAGWESDPNSPSSPTSRSPVSIFRRKIWRSSTEPNGAISVDDETRPVAGNETSGVRFEQTTPVDATPPGDDDEGDDYSETVSEGLSRTQSIPPAPDRGLKRPRSSDRGSRSVSPRPPDT